MRPPTPLIAVAVCLAVALPPTAASTAHSTSAAPTDTSTVVAPPKPNIIFIHTDDLSPNLLPYMSALTGPQGLAKSGATFRNYFVADSLCCPSRATILTGEMPHNTGIRTNTANDGDGGWPVFKRRGHEARTYAVPLRRHGYRTGYLGKYMNGYTFAPGYKPPQGWDEWHVAGNGGYGHFNYKITRFVRGKVRTIDTMRRSPSDPDRTYITDVLAKRAKDFVDRSGRRPFFLQISTFAPHSGGGQNGEPKFPPAVRDRPKSQGGELLHGDCGPAKCNEIRHPRTAAFNEDTGDKPWWVRRDPLTRSEINVIDRNFRNRVRMVQSVNDLIKGVLRSLTPAERRDTYVVFSPDNGFHLGEHRLLSGKGTAYDHDVRIPLIISGPGVRHRRIDKIAQNVDFYPTFLQMAGIRPPDDRDGQTLTGLLAGANPASWRKAALVEHKTERPNRADPDLVLAARNTPAPTYNALRTLDALLVDYAALGQPVEFYDLDGRIGAQPDPLQLRNEPDWAPAQLIVELQRMAVCGRPGRPGCWEESLSLSR
ncbi:sulfatase [Nocardioides speluncae]|uniref:sulfatase family protein n=1 Tax=Nocardioides speluncae TaxID=2670337 RepID=UPI000D68C1CD|nr:sulfatase [Nocardioides speluncae]